MTGGEGRVDAQQQRGRKSENVWGVGGEDKMLKLNKAAKLREQSKTWQTGEGWSAVGESEAAQSHGKPHRTSREAAAHWSPCRRIAPCLTRSLSGASEQEC